jgi:hypothetical protein
MAAAGVVAGLTLPSGMASAAESAASSPGRAVVSAASLANLGINPESRMLENSHSEKCLSSAGQDDTNAVQISCNSGSPNQYWLRTNDFAGSGYFEYINQGTQQCLGVSGGSTKPGATVVVWNCLGGTGHLDQYWNFSGDGAGNGIALTDLKSGYVLQITGASTADWAPADQEPYDEAGSPNQVWYYGTFGPNA